jgi:hypothetical protein
VLWLLLADPVYYTDSRHVSRQFFFQLTTTTIKYLAVPGAAVTTRKNFGWLKFFETNYV